MYIQKQFFYRITDTTNVASIRDFHPKNVFRCTAFCVRKMENWRWKREQEKKTKQNDRFPIIRGQIDRMETRFCFLLAGWLQARVDLKIPIEVHNLRYATLRNVMDFSNHRRHRQENAVFLFLRVIPKRKDKKIA